MSNVRSVPLVNGEEVTQRVSFGCQRLIIGLLALAFGLPLWAIGAKWSLDGWIIGLNLVGSVLEVPAQIAEPRGWWNLICLPLGVGYSLAELFLRPKWQKDTRLGYYLAAVFLALLAHGSDIGSTFLTAMTPAPDDWQVAHQAAKAVWPAALWAVLLTYIPEQLILLGLRYIGLR